MSHNLEHQKVHTRMVKEVLKAVARASNHPYQGTVAKLAMRQPFVLFKGLTFQKLC